MAAYGVDADSQYIRNLLAWFAGLDQTEHFLLPISENVGAAFGKIRVEAFPGLAV